MRRRSFHHDYFKRGKKRVQQVEWVFTYNRDLPLYSEQGMGNDYRQTVVGESHVFRTQGSDYQYSDGGSRFVGQRKTSHRKEERLNNLYRMMHGLLYRMFSPIQMGTHRLNVCQNSAPIIKCERILVKRCR